MTEGGDTEAQIARLIREGRHADAAKLCLGAGDPLRASELFAAAWDYANAIASAEAAGRFDVAYRHVLTSGDRRVPPGLLERLADHPDQALAAAEHARSRGRLADAARLSEIGAAVADAAALYEQAGELGTAARCRESEGRYREAGMLYERQLREVPDDAEAALRLGRILLHFGRYEHAVRAFQVAAASPEHRDEALPLLVASFDALGMSEAAAAALAEARRFDPSTPTTIPALLAQTFGNERGLAGLCRDGDAAQLLAGRYRVVRPLGSGATGRVLLAQDGFYERDVAVKVLTVAGGSSAGRDAYVRFAREARVAAGLDHPNVVRVHEFNPDGPFLVMEFMAGGTLEDRLAPGAGLPLPVVRHVLVSVLAGLEAVHRRGVVHRDLKPANIFFSSAGDVKLGDFGVAHLQDLGATLTGAMLGTLAYMAPEQITGETAPDASTDFYALGVILFRMLTGVLPFRGPDFVTQHLRDAPPRPSDVSPGLAEGHDGLVLDLLAKRSADRPRTAAEVRGRVDSLPWIDPGDRAVDVATGASHEAPSVPPPPSEDAGTDRYEVVGIIAPGVTRARDRLLDRPVLLERCDAARAARLRDLARADSPFLQAVFHVDAAAGRAVLEHPSGVPFDRAGLDARGRAHALGQVAVALAELHRAGVAHGQVGPEAIRCSDGRTVLLLPDGAAAAVDSAADLAALRRL